MKHGYVPWTYNYIPSKCPCHNCKDRTVHCHGTCKKYKDWQNQKPKVKSDGIFKEGYYR